MPRSSTTWRSRAVLRHRLSRRDAFACWERESAAAWTSSSQHPLPRGEPRFHAFLHAIDVLLLPVVNLGQREAWSPFGADQWVAAGFTVMGWGSSEPPPSSALQPAPEFGVCPVPRSAGYCRSRCPLVAGVRSRASASCAGRRRKHDRHQLGISIITHPLVGGSSHGDGREVTEARSARRSLRLEVWVALCAHVASDNHMVKVDHDMP